MKTTFLLQFLLAISFTSSAQQGTLDKEAFLSYTELWNYLKTANTVSPNSSIASPFDTIEYDKVIAYDFDGRHEKHTVILKNGQFVSTVIKQQFLTQAQADQILNALTKKSSYGGQTAACFEPLFAIVFFKSNKMVNQINVCLDCNYLESSIEIPAQLKNTIKIEKEVYSMIGFSKKGAKAIKRLCKEIDFLYGSY